MAATIRLDQLAELVKGLATEVREYIGNALEPIATKQADLEQRVVELERAQRERENGST